MRAIARSTRRRKSLLSRQSSGRSKSVQPALEVEVELAAGLVELRPAPRAPAARPASARSSSSSSASWFGQADPDQAARGRGEQQRAEGRVGGRVGDVEQSLVGGALGEALLQLVLFMPAPFSVA